MQSTGQTETHDWSVWSMHGCGDDVGHGVTSVDELPMPGHAATSVGSRRPGVGILSSAADVAVRGPDVRSPMGRDGGGVRPAGSVTTNAAPPAARPPRRSSRRAPRDPARDRQTEPGPAGAVASDARQPGERLEDALAVGGGDARALVGDDQLDPWPGPPDRDRDASRPGGEWSMALSRRISRSWTSRSRSPLRSAGPGSTAHRRGRRRARRASAVGLADRVRAIVGEVDRRRASMTNAVASVAASWSRSPTSRPSRSASAMMSATSGRPSSATSPSRSRTSALARMSAAGVRSSCDASATNRRWASNASRIGTSARPVTTSVTTAAPTRPTRPTSRIAAHEAPRLLVVQGEDEAALDVADGPPVAPPASTATVRSADRASRPLDRPEVPPGRAGPPRPPPRPGRPGRLTATGWRRPCRRVEDEQERVRRARMPSSLSLGPRRPCGSSSCERGRDRVDAGGQRAVDVGVERAERRRTPSPRRSRRRAGRRGRA